MKRLLYLALLVGNAMPAAAQEYDARVERVLSATPLIDGHNDWAEALREREGDARWTIDLSAGLDAKPVPYNTDIARLRKGMVGGQFWSVFVSSGLSGEQQVKETLEYRSISSTSSLPAIRPCSKSRGRPPMFGAFTRLGGSPR